MGVLEMGVQCAEVVKDIFHLSFNSQEELARTFLRFQEHYESPEFRGRVFSLDDYVEWYVANSPGGMETGRFTYYEDWCGFNIPSYVLEPFYAGGFDPLSGRERTVLDFFSHMRTRRFYIIGTCAEFDHDALEHEIAHGLFYTDTGYRQEVLEVISMLDAGDVDLIRQDFAAGCGYHPSVFDDETHAYLLTDPESVVEAGVDASVVRDVRCRLKDIYSSYVRGLREG